jgi:hypothetical protein
MFLKKDLLQNNRVEAKVMKKQLAIIGIIALLVCVGLSGCQESNLSNLDKDKFVGTWNGTVPAFGTDEKTFILFSNNTFAIRTLNLNGTWEIIDGKLVFPVDEGGQLIYSYIFSNNDRTLTITEVKTGDSSVLTRQ